MPVTVVVGGQFGSEGKGKVSHFLAREENIPVVVRIGGPNSGHTVVAPSGESIVFRQLPTAALLPDVTCVIAAGSYVNLNILFKEIEMTSVTSSRLMIDANAMVVSDADMAEERQGSLGGSIGSTLSGTGAAVSRRISRRGSVRLARDCPDIKQFVKPVLPFLRDQLNSDQRILIEGTQGYGLSLLHSPYYPYATSRDTTAAGFLSEVGLSPMDVDDVVLVLRAFPIRVTGNSGPLPDEIDWDIVAKESGSDQPIIEYTSVTQTVRRIGRFNTEIVCMAIMANNPTRIVLNHLDHVQHTNSTSAGTETKVETFVYHIEKLLNTEIAFLGFGPSSLIKRTEQLFRAKAG